MLNDTKRYGICEDQLRRLECVGTIERQKKLEHCVPPFQLPREDPLAVCRNTLLTEITTITDGSGNGRTRFRCSSAVEKKSTPPAGLWGPNSWHRQQRIQALLPELRPR